MTCDTSHGWIKPRTDGARARCGGPTTCPTCQTEKMHEAMIAACFGVPVSPVTSGAPTLTMLADTRLGALADAIASANWSTCSKNERTLLRETATWLRAASTHVDLLRDIPRFLSVDLSRETYVAFPHPALDAGDAQTAAARDVLAERQRQISAEGWTPEHDDAYTDEQLARAAVCYALPQGDYEIPEPPEFWPWDRSWWKPGDRRRELVKASALILAEIERLDRAAIAARQIGEGA